MLAITPEAPRWLRDLERFIHLKSLLILQGNVLDLIAYPIQEGNGAIYWTESDLSGFWARFLQGLGYGLCAWLDPVDGLSFSQPHHEALYADLLGEGNLPASQPTPGTPRWQLAGRQLRNRQGEIDLPVLFEQWAKVSANRRIPCALVADFSSHWLGNPGNLGAAERSLFLRVLKANLASREVLAPEARWQNSLILICDRVNDLPPFLYLNNPRSRILTLDKPDTVARRRFGQTHYPAFAQADGTPSSDWLAEFAVRTEGLAHYELLSLVGLSRREQLPASQLGVILERYRYGVRESVWDQLDSQRLQHAPELIRRRLRGQTAAVERVLTLVKRAKLGLGSGSRQRPRGVLFFAGPTGVGKTELAKALAELLFGSDERLVRFDMSEYAQPHADQKLLGAPPGYVGYEEGGQLTNALKNNPFCVVLFDEIEKAHPSLFDKFLQILDDGRLTDGRGETVYFAEAVLVFTSNLGTVAHDTRQPQPIGPELSYAQLRSVLLERIRAYFLYTLGRPELLNRFGDNFVIFDFIRPPLHAEILGLLTAQFVRQLRQEYHLQVQVAPAVTAQLETLGLSRLGQGGRGLRNLLESALINPLARWLFDQGSPRNRQLILTALQVQAVDADEAFVLEVTDAGPA